MAFDLLLSARRWRAFACTCLLWMAVLLPAQAHDPFEGNIELLVFDNKLEARITLGFDAARASLAHAGLTPAAVLALKREAAMSESGSARLPLTAVAALASIASPDGQLLSPSAAHIAFGDMETVFLLIYPRARATSVQLTTPLFNYITAMRPMTVASADSNGKVLARAVLAQGSATANLALVAASGKAAAIWPGMFKLGIGHILEGYDHLLFLGALLLGMHALGPMLGVLTAFTLAHSLTLALAVVGLASPPDALVEPMIALSIIIACLNNLRQSEAAAPRYWIAAGFGFIHGFGFAEALGTELGTAGETIVLPLLAFNAGVEAGQLLIALPVIAALRLARRHAGFVQYGLPALSVVVAAVGAMWFGHRIWPI